MFKRRRALLKNEDDNLKKIQEFEFEKNDILAIILAGMITILPIVILVLLLFYGLIWLLFL